MILTYYRWDLQVFSSFLMSGMVCINFFNICTPSCVRIFSAVILRSVWSLCLWLESLHVCLCIIKWIFCLGLLFFCTIGSYLLSFCVGGHWVQSCMRCWLVILPFIPMIQSQHAERYVVWHLIGSMLESFTAAYKFEGPNFKNMCWAP